MNLKKFSFLKMNKGSPLFLGGLLSFLSLEAMEVSLEQSPSLIEEHLLPPELWTAIVEYLPPQDMGSFGKVSKGASHIIRGSYFCQEEIKKFKERERIFTLEQLEEWISPSNSLKKEVFSVIVKQSSGVDLLRVKRVLLGFLELQKDSLTSLTLNIGDPSEEFSEKRDIEAIQNILSSLKKFSIKNLVLSCPVSGNRVFNNGFGGLPGSLESLTLRFFSRDRCNLLKSWGAFGEVSSVSIRGYLTNLKELTVFNVDLYDFFEFIRREAEGQSRPLSSMSFSVDNFDGHFETLEACYLDYFSSLNKNEVLKTFSLEYPVPEWSSRKKEGRFSNLIDKMTNFDYTIEGDWITFQRRESIRN